MGTHGGRTPATGATMRRAALCAIVLVAAACAGSDKEASEPIAIDSAPATTVDPPAAAVAATPATTAESTTTSTTTTSTTTSTTTTLPPAEAVRMNHIQVVGSHNSFHLIPQPVLFEGIMAVSAELGTGIEYSHRTLTDQLDEFGIRQFELDVFADPDGGLYANRASNAVVGLPIESGEPALDEPGFKVMHTQDFDYETTCLTLVACLGEIDAWSSDNSNHVPIVVLIELKSLSVPQAAAEEGLVLDLDLPWAVPVETTADVLLALDDEVRSVLSSDRLLEPDEVRGDAATLADAVEGIGWPELASARGQVVVVLNDAGSQRDLYIADTPALEGRAMFTSSTPGAPDAAFIRFDDPTDPGLDAAAAAGYLIRTRTDSPTVDARENDTTTRDIALASGAHFLSTDYYEPSTHFDSPYVVALPNGSVARCNPVTAPASCSPELLTE
jgi:hypothetical protein